MSNLTFSTPTAYKYKWKLSFRSVNFSRIQSLFTCCKNQHSKYWAFYWLKHLPLDFQVYVKCYSLSRLFKIPILNPKFPSISLQSNCLQRMFSIEIRRDNNFVLTLTYSNQMSHWESCEVVYSTIYLHFFFRSCVSFIISWILHPKIQHFSQQ